MSQDNHNAIIGITRSRSIWNWLNLVSFVVNVVVVLFIGILGAFLQRPTYARLLQAFPTLLTPIHWIVSTSWPVIFISQMAWVVWQLWDVQVGSFQTTYRLRYCYVGLTLTQIVWTGLWLYRYVFLSTIALVASIFFLWNMDLGQTSLLEFWMIQFPMSMHCGWVWVLIIIQLGMIQIEYNVTIQARFWTSFGTIIGLAVLQLVAFSRMFFCHRNRDRQGGFYSSRTLDLIQPIVVAWGTLGMYLELRQGPVEDVVDQYTESQLQMMEWTTLVVTAVLVGTVILRAIVGIIWCRPPPREVAPYEQDVVAMELEEARQIQEATRNSLQEQHSSSPSIHVSRNNSNRNEPNNVAMTLTPEEFEFVFGHDPTAPPRPTAPTRPGGNNNHNDTTTVLS